MTFTKTHADRLLTLAYFLKTQVPSKHFSMGNFTNNGLVEVMETLVTDKPNCGTTACAVGWCPAVFPKDWEWRADDNADPRLIDSPEYFEDWTPDSSSDSREFFGVDSDEWNHVFGGHNTRTPKREATVIERFVESKGYVYAESK